MFRAWIAAFQHRLLRIGLWGPRGGLPLQDWAVEKRDVIMENQDKLEHLDPRVKCLPAALPRAHLPVGYNTYQILQVPGAVIILYE